MNNLESIVPPLELCKRIPAGKFADSALVWNEDETYPGASAILDVRGNKIFSEGWRNIPAPTLAEIMATLPACTCYRIGKTWTVALCNDTLDNGVKSRRAATAALRLWLEVEGVKDEQ